MHFGVGISCITHFIYLICLAVKTTKSSDCCTDTARTTRAYMYILRIFAKKKRSQRIVVMHFIFLSFIRWSHKTRWYEMMRNDKIECYATKAISVERKIGEHLMHRMFFFPLPKPTNADTYICMSLWTGIHDVNINSTDKHKKETCIPITRQK